MTARQLCIVYSPTLAAGLRWLLPLSDAFRRRYELRAYEMRYEDLAGHITIPKEELSACGLFICHLPDAPIFRDANDRGAYADFLARLPTICRHITLPLPRFQTFWPFEADGPHEALFHRLENRAGVLPSAFRDTFFTGALLDADLLEQPYPEEAAITSYLGLDITAAVDLDERLRQDLAALRRAEQHTDVKLAEFVAAEFHRRKPFATSLRPANPLWLHIADQILERERLAPLRPGFGDTLRPITMHESPIHPGIGRYFGLGYITQSTRYRIDRRRSLTFAEYLGEIAKPRVALAAETRPVSRRVPPKHDRPGTSWHFFAPEREAAGDGRPTCVLFTSCIGNLIKHFLELSPEFRRAFAVRPYFAVNNEVYPEIAEALLAELAGCAVFVYHAPDAAIFGPVYEQPLGRALAALPQRAARIPLPLPFCNAFWPFNRPDPRLGDPTRPPNRFRRPPIYHQGDGYLLELLRQGWPAQAAVAHYLAADVAQLADLDKLLADSLAVMERAEAGGPVRIAGFVADLFRREKLFQSIVHPTGRLLHYAANCLLQALDCPKLPDAALQRIPEMVDEPVPIHPSIGRHFGAPYISDDTRYPIDDLRCLTYAEYLHDIARFEEGLIDRGYAWSYYDM